MRVRALNGNHDWLFGKGQNDYLRDNKAVAQNIDTRLNSFLGDCFFATGDGLDWFNLLGEKDQLALQLAISAVILNTAEVTGLLQIFSELNPITRDFQVRYTVQTTYSRISSVFQFNSSELA